MKLEELPDAKLRTAELKTSMDDLRNKIQANTSIARAANAANVGLMSSLKTCRKEFGELCGQIRVAEDEIRKVKTEKVASEQQALAEENAKRAASIPPQPTISELMKEIKQLKEAVVSKD